MSLLENSSRKWPLTHSALTHTLTHLITHSLCTYLLTHSLSHSVTHLKKSGRVLPFLFNPYLIIKVSKIIALNPPPPPLIVHKSYNIYSQICFISLRIISQLYSEYNIWYCKPHSTGL